MDMKELLQQAETEELHTLAVFIDGLIRGRETAAITAADANERKPRKRSTCSICHQSGHRAPNCKAKPPEGARDPQGFQRPA